MKDKYTEHHVTPRSRLKKDETVVLLPKMFHAALHIVFENLYGKEMIYFIEELEFYMRSRDKVSISEIKAIREKIKKRSW